MKMYLFLAILIYKCSNHFSCAEFELAEASHAENDPSVPLAFNPEKENDYTNNNGLLFEFRRSVKSDNTEIEARRRSALDKNFMRFGRNDPVLQRVARASKQANLMRFGRADRGFMRFGRLPDHVPYSLAYFKDSHNQLSNDDSRESLEEPSFAKRTPNSEEDTEISESGEQIKPKQLVYFRRDSPKNLMRFGKRGDDENMLRVERANLMRFGRAGTNLQRANLLRFGRASSGNLMRFGRSKGNLMRFGRSDPRFLRLIKMDNNFMRFGRAGKGLKSTSSNETGATDSSSNASLDSEINRATEDNAVSQERTPSSSDEDYEIHLREDLLAPIYVTNK